MIRWYDYAVAIIFADILYIMAVAIPFVGILFAAAIYDTFWPMYCNYRKNMET